MDQRAYQSSSDQEIDDVHVLVSCNGIHDIEDVFHCAESQTNQDAEDDQVAWVGLFVCYVYIVSCWIFHIFFRIGGDDVVEEQDVDPYDESSVCDGDEEQWSDKEYLP